jgi:L,D-peptidoglycan transpeptidase YkuD (ErfK/YbiS/YcfS/YnhG family)
VIVTVDTHAATIAFDGSAQPCAIGRGGACPADRKREGDGCTPVGLWPVRVALLRPDRGLAVPERLPWRWLRPADGWSDDPADPAYNRAVSHPHRFSAERLWRDDTLYDAILVLGHNDAPPVAGKGSAIFLHLREGDTTDGCVAVAVSAMRRLLASLAPGDAIDIV